jgi:hypothetical protein
MKRKKMLKEINAIIHSNEDLLIRWANGDMTYDKMASKLSGSFLKHVEDLGMLPPETYYPGLPEIEGNKCVLMWDEELE